MSQPEILLTGATGYVGGRLLRAFEQRGVVVRCMARRPEYLKPRVGAGTEVVEGDALDASSLRAPLEGIDTAYYLIHSMGATGDFAEQDREAAENFARASRAAGVRRIVYLGGLGHAEDLSGHLASRQEVGEILRRSNSVVIEFRASIIIGSGSLSFEMIRALVRKLPVMITPSWVRSIAQPIAIEDVIDYLVAATEKDFEESRIFEIGGADRVSYGDIMMEYATQRGLKRWMIPVPVLSLGLSSLWLGLVTPLYARVGKKMIASVKNDTVVRDQAALDEFEVEPRGISDAIERALQHEDHELAETRWSDALSSKGDPKSWGGVRFRNRIIDSRELTVDTPLETAFTPIRRIGGDVGWYYGTWLWKLRGFLDRLVGGVGTRRGRRDADDIRTGDTLDFWRVERYERNRRLLLAAEMRVPGRAWLQFEVEEKEEGTEIRQTAIFDPGGLLGLAYWYLLYPLHRLVFRGMLQGVANAAVELNEGAQ